jgi:hypothetical protein
MDAATCPWCEAPRKDGPDCPRCGANYAKAEAIRTHGRAGVTVAAATQAGDEPEVLIYADADEGPEAGAVIDDARTEFLFSAAAIPAMLLIAVVFQSMEWGRFVQRLVFTMPVHELGHAVTAWLCGFGAIPTVWITITMEERGLVAPLAVFAAIAWILYRGWQLESRALLAAGGLVLLLQVVLTLGLKEHTARSLIVFGGDGTGLVLSILLMASFFFGKRTQLYKGSLRWGFVAIGAGAFVDINAVWWAARRDSSEIPFTTRDNGLESDALRLVNEFGWTEAALVNRHIMVCLACMAILALVYAWGVHRAWLKAQAVQGVS